MAKKGDDNRLLTRATDFEAGFSGWFNQHLANILEDNRRRYRMKLKEQDKKDREELGLSTLPPTKSAAVVDRAVEKAILEYHGEPDAISFNMQAGILDIEKQLLSRWLTKIFEYRADRTFPFVTWHTASLTQGFCDGLEAAMAYWRKESYVEKTKAYVRLDAQPTGDGFNVEMVPTPISEEEYRIGAEVRPDIYEEIEQEEEFTVKDTWWIDSLKPGVDVLWDFKAALLNANEGEACLVKLTRSLDELEAGKDNDIFDLFDSKRVEAAKGDNGTKATDSTATAGDKANIKVDDIDRIPLWAFFYKERGRWMVSFSIGGEFLISSPKTVDEVYFGGRRVNLLPVVIGTHKVKLWEALGRGEPETIAPLEDELTEQKNNVADASRMAIQGRWRVDQDHDINLNDLLNGRVFEADKGTYDKIDEHPNIIDTLRSMDSLEKELAELIPVGMDNRNVVPRGTARTLGAVHLALGHQNEKLSVQLIVRNQTFFEPLLYLIAQLIMAFETDETILRVAGRNAGAKVPEIPTAEGVMVDLDALDFPVEVKISAGLGSQPRQEKANNILQLTDWRLQHGIPTDLQKVAQQLNVLVGYEPTAFDGKAPEPDKAPKLTGNLNIDFNLLPPEMQRMALGLLFQPGNEVAANVQGDTPVLGTGGEGAAVTEEPASAGGIEQGGQGGY